MMKIEDFLKLKKEKLLLKIQWLVSVFSFSPWFQEQKNLVVNNNW